MGFKHKLYKDYKGRYFFEKNELNIVLLSYCMKLTNIGFQNKAYLYFKFLRNFHLNSSSSRIVNRCLLTGRSSWVLRNFRMSRITFKEFAEYGKLNGVRRAIW